MEDTVFNGGFFTTALWIALGVCCLGLLWRLVSWLVIKIGPDAKEVSFFQRLGAAIIGGIKAIFSKRLPGIIGGFVLDSLLQRRLFKVSKKRWLGHMLLFYGCLVLIVMHALHVLLADKLFSDYQATLNPFLLLRNVFGVATLVGVVLMTSGRKKDWGKVRPARLPIDALFGILVVVIVVTGFLLEAQKMSSPKAFNRMAEEYGIDEDEIKGLRWVWKLDYGVAFPDLEGEPDPDLLEEGRGYNEDYCVGCHSKPQHAFVSYPVAKAAGLIATSTDAANVDKGLLYIHIFACFFAIALLPFTRVFHVVADPISLVVRGAASSAPLSKAGRVNRRALAMDACIRCGLCDFDCSVGPIAKWMNNQELLPSRKVQATRLVASRSEIKAGQAERLAVGAHLCTDCGRCTDRCPVGLDLADLWDAGRGDLSSKGFPAPAVWVKEEPAIAWAEALGAELGRVPPAGPLTADRNQFSACVQCQTCTNVCPVVANSGEDRVDLAPQQVMNLLRLGMNDLALGSKMVWDCATCYQCQENCPEGIRVTDIMLELRGAAWRQLGPVRDRRRSI